MIRDHRGIVGTGAAVVAATFAIPAVARAQPAGPHRQLDPVAVIACASKGCKEDVKLTVPAGGTGMVATDQLPVAATQATVTVQPQTSADDKDFKDMTMVLAALPTRHVRLLGCLFFYFAYVGLIGEQDYDFVQPDPTEAALFLAACAQIATSLPTSTPPVSADLAAAGCSRAARRVAIRITRAGRGYRGHVSGRTSAGSGVAGAAISCRRMGAGLQISIRPRKRGRKLRQVVGPMLGIGLANRGRHAIGTHTTFVIR